MEGAAVYLQVAVFCCETAKLSLFRYEQGGNVDPHFEFTICCFRYGVALWAVDSSFFGPHARGEILARGPVDQRIAWSDGIVMTATPVDHYPCRSLPNVRLWR